MASLLMIGIYHDVCLKVAHPRCVIKYNKYFSQSTHRIFRKGKATCFGSKRIAVMRTTAGHKRGLITIVIRDLSLYSKNTHIL